MRTSRPRRGKYAGETPALPKKHLTFLRFPSTRKILSVPTVPTVPTVLISHKKAPLLC